MRKLGFKNIIIGLTANTLQEEWIEFAKAGTDLLLSKPLRGGTLDAIIKIFVETAEGGLGGLQSKLNENMRLKLTHVQQVDSTGIEDTTPIIEWVTEESLYNSFSTLSVNKPLLTSAITMTKSR